MLDIQALTLNALQGSTWLADTLRADGRKVVAIEQWINNVEFENVARGTTQRQTIDIPPTSDFICNAMSFAGYASASGAPDFSSFYGRVQITDIGTGKQIFTTPANVRSSFGNFGIPLLLPSPKTFVAGSKILFEFSLPSTDTFDSNVYFNLMGVRVYYEN